MAQHWAEFQNYSGDEPATLYYQKSIERYGQPALDVGCGTGRLLLPYLRAGLDVDGCDISPDMLAHCREDINPLEQTLTLKYWAQHWQGEELLGEEKRILTSNIYFKNELVLLLKQAGFNEVSVQGDFTSAEATPEHDDLVFIARKSP